MFFAVCSFSGQNAREGSPSCALSIESSHGIEKGITPFASTGVGKRMHHNRGCEVLLTDYPQSLSPQPPAGTGSGLGPVIGDWDSRLNCTPGNTTHEATYAS